MNEQLRQELLAMQEEDQQVLRELIDSSELKGQEYHPRMRAVHEKNNARIKAIIDEHGWPGRSLVGEDGAKAAWLIVQHAVLDSGFMERTLLLLRDAVRNGEAEGRFLAYLQDRVLTMAGEPQIYGTQYDFDKNGNAYPLPIREPDKVEQLRREIGLEPLSEATQRIQARYRPRKGHVRVED